MSWLRWLVLADCACAGLICSPSLLSLLSVDGREGGGSRAELTLKRWGFRVSVDGRSAIGHSNITNQ